jgi:hypothetical protein
VSFISCFILMALSWDGVTDCISCVPAVACGVPCLISLALGLRPRPTAWLVFCLLIRCPTCCDRGVRPALWKERPYGLGHGVGHSCVEVSTETVPRP